jgi:hypothetical protein
MARPTAILLLAAALATAGGGVARVAVAGEPVVAHSGGPASLAGVICAPPADHEAPPAAGPGQTVVSFVVPARTFVRVDTGGRPVAAMTNTGCAPSATDAVVVVDAAGRARSGSTVAVDDVAWTGDWSRAGEWHDWPSAG